jgi:hypothetical protein
MARARQLLRSEAKTVSGVIDARVTSFVINSTERAAIVKLDITTSEETYREELDICLNLA